MRLQESMDVLIVTGEDELASLWGRHLERSGATVRHAVTQEVAISALDTGPVDVVILNMTLDGGSAIAVADYAGYRHPKAKVISVTNDSFFSNGAVFDLLPNVRAQVANTTPPDDLVAMVEHYGDEGQD